MQHEEAKQLLELCRPGHEADRLDPALAEAFALLETDAELRAWFEEQQALDARISDHLNSIEPPADLKAGILAGMRLHKAHATETSPEAENPAIVFPQEQDALLGGSPKRTWWLNPWTGIAALFVIMMALLHLPEGTPDANASNAIAGLPPVLQFLSKEIDSLRTWDFDKRDDQADNLRTYLASQHEPSPDSIPSYLSKMPTIGCVTFDYQGSKLSMICFKNGEVYHLITADKATYPDTLPVEPEIFQAVDKVFKVWVEGEQVKILTVHGTIENIPESI